MFERLRAALRKSEVFLVLSVLFAMAAATLALTVLAVNPKLFITADYEIVWSSVTIAIYGLLAVSVVCYFFSL